VSRVVNGGKASEAVKRKVQKAIDELGYAPSIAAQSLVSRRTGCIGLAVNSTQSAWFSEILAGIEEALAPSQKSVLLSSLMLNGHYDASAVQGWITARRVDGLVFVRHSQRGQVLLDAAEQAGLPVVLIAPDLEDCSHFSVRSNNAQAGRLAANHLLDLGHERIAFAGGPRQSADSRMRRVGVEEALHERGLTLARENVWFGPAYGHEAGVQYARQFLETPKEQRASAVVLGNDAMALGFLREVLSQGLQVPRDVSIVGFDGTPDGGRCFPGLTTVQQPTRRMAADACRTLLDDIDDKAPPSDTSAHYPVLLIERESTGTRQ